ncbi:hypothetical protein, partial [Staphylococcus capitis]
NILVKLFISEIVHTEDSFLLKLYYKFNFATEPLKGKRYQILLLNVATIPSIGIIKPSIIPSNIVKLGFGIVIDKRNVKAMA